MIFKDEKPAILVLNNGLYFEGIGLGTPKKVVGEITFNTIPGSGYIELLTNPSNKGKIIVCTYPSIGNYGVPAKEHDEYGLLKHFQSDSIQINGLVVSELCKKPSHYESIKTLEEWLMEEQIPAIEWVDTRRLTQFLVENEITMGILQVFKRGELPDIKALQTEAKNLKSHESVSLTEEVSIKSVKTYNCKNPKGNVVLIDLGVKNSLLRTILSKNMNVILVPYDFSLNKILELNPDAIMISDGPGNPKQYENTIHILKELFTMEIPVLGIGLGHNLLGVAAGAEIVKMKAPHRGGRTTVENETNKCYITYQNHGYCLKNIRENGFIESFHDKDDGSNEGLLHKEKPILSVLFNPEGSPGALDMKEYIFNKFINSIEVEQ